MLYFPIPINNEKYLDWFCFGIFAKIFAQYWLVGFWRGRLIVYRVANRIVVHHGVGVPFWTTLKKLIRRILQLSNGGQYSDDVLQRPVYHLLNSLLLHGRCYFNYHYLVIAKQIGLQQLRCYFPCCVCCSYYRLLVFVMIVNRSSRSISFHCISEWQY